MIRRVVFGLTAMLLLVILVIAYNLVRHYVFWSPHEEVRFASGTIELAGTLVKPEGSGPFPTVVMLHGSGREPRFDPTGRAVINALVRHGIAVLAYDKRGVGESGGDFESALYRDFIDDALAAIDYLKTRPDVDGARLGLYTVSESGWFGPEIAIRRPAIRFIFNKVAPVMSRNDAVAWEVYNEALEAGVNPADAQRISQLALRRWKYYIATSEDPSLASGPRRDELQAQMTALRNQLGAHADQVPEVVWPYDADEYAAFSADASYDPTPWLNQLNIPQFYAYGGTDVNIPTRECLPIVAALSKRPGADITVRLYPDLGHSLLTWKGLFTAGFPPDYLDSLGRWAASHSDQGSRKQGEF